LVVLTTLACAATSRSEILPTEGTFRGYYHVNAAGVGRFSFFLIPATLKERFAPYDAKYIEVQVLKGRQPMNHGPAIADEVGTITVVPQALRAELRIVSPGVCGADTFDVVAVITNSGKEPMPIDPNNSFLDVLSAPDGEPPRRDLLYDIGYSAAQLGFGANTRGGVVCPQFWQYEPGTIRLDAGQSVGLVWMRNRLARGEHELHVVLGDPLKPDEHAEAWLAIHSPVAATVAPPPRWQVDGRIERDDEWFRIDGRLRPVGADSRTVFLPSGSKGIFLPGQYQFITTDGQRVEADLDRDQPGVPDGWGQQAVDSEGVKWQLGVRSPDCFSTAVVDRIELWLPTEDGVVPLVLARDLHMPLGIAPPPWGETVNGARLRIAMPRATWKRGEQLRFYYQAESTQPGKRVFRTEHRREPPCCQVLIDGTVVRIFSGGVSTGILYDFPFQGVTRLAYNLSLSPGRHALVFTVTGDGGSHTNARGEKIPRFEGTLVSNAVEFEMAE
jgi:hypothetical protein